MLGDEKRGRVLNTLSKSGQSGFTLVELLIGVAVLAILITFAMPNLRTWTVNIQIRNAAESAQNGLQRARGEAVARNTNVEFAFLGDNTSTAWEVRLPGAVDPIDSRTSKEGSVAVSRTITPVGATTVTFNNFGLLTANSDASATITMVEFDAVELDPNLSRELDVVIAAPNGNVRMCDPHAHPDSLTKC